MRPGRVGRLVRVLVVRVGVGVRHRAGARPRPRPRPAQRHGRAGVSVAGAVSVPPVRAECPRLLGRPRVGEAEGLLQVPRQPTRGGVAAGSSSLGGGRAEAEVAVAPGLAPAAPLHAGGGQGGRAGLARPSLHWAEPRWGSLLVVTQVSHWW